MEIQITGLTKQFGDVPALRGVDLTIPSGMFGLLGPNGAGKTTLMRILAGILHASAGAVRVGTHDLSTDAGRQAVKWILGYLPQELGVYPDLTGTEFLEYIAILKGMRDGARRRARVAQLIETVGLEDAARRQLRTYSGGMKRRIGIAQALLNDPRLLIVDEPTAGLDPEERIRFRNMLVALAGDRTVLLCTHIVEDVAQTSHRVALLLGGRVVFDGTTTGLAQAADGRVWSLDSSGPAPSGDLTVVSAIAIERGMRYRVVSEVPPAGASAVAPTLEDGYVAVMQKRRAA
ncbi:MAG TPA: ABC transporter ATP-binding protein [Candidatus Acidoferrales bacterium]|nr:ABC transporter ATP-binding protein [Candidatus Acidoferrales bacterium]